ncbi:hypothetical protein BT96DRAFT_888541 [Gymnopus androsaceus JB14]|uniref:Protein transport protein sec16 n=1 Tax=Gymnopus androsaceus JB14 TaxID=1447944 RepID=A0A6A4H0B8_9AGAR|nr:hypothetical protein BT96DRAFT_888541 [Gymnopus androsaceus JB14]
MSGLEAAASLFGSEDPASDPFASLGSDSQPPSATHQANDDLFAVNDASSPPEFLADPQVYPEPASTQDAVFQPAEQHNSWPETNSYDSVPQNTTEQNYGAQQPVQNYGEQWQGYSQQTSYNSAYNAYAPSQYNNSQIAAAPQAYSAIPPSKSGYDSYAPSNASQAYAPASQSTYGSYTPAQPQVANTYAPAPPASTQAAYGSYAAPVQSNYGVPSYTAPPQNPYGYQAAPAPTGAVIPPPPPPATKVPLTRPKVSNAYDPPFPTTTSRKQSRNITSPPTFNHYTSLSPPPPLPPTQRSVLPPPPPGVSNGGSRPPSVSYNVPPTISSNYGSNMGRNQANGVNIEGLPHSNGASATLSYAPPPSNSYQPSGAVQSYAPPNPPNNMTHDSLYDPYTAPSEEVKSENNQLNPELEPLQSTASSTFVDSHNGAVNQASYPEYTGSQNGSPEVRTAPPRASTLDSTSPPVIGGPPKRASSAASMRAFRTQSPLPGGSEPSRPRSSNSGIRTSPGSTHHSAGSSFDLYSPKVGQIPEERVPSPVLSNNATFDPYAPNNRMSSPAPLEKLPSNPPIASNPYAPTNSYFPAQSTSSPPQPQGPHGVSPYLPGSKPAAPPPRNRSMSNGSVLSTLSEDPGPYAAPNLGRLQSNESDYGGYSSRYNYPENEQVSPVPPPSSGLGSSGLGSAQEILMKAPTYTAYAPSPSLLGTNDPLGRAGARVPVFSFGFGGKFVTCFHGADKMNTGFDVALASRNSTGVEIRVLNKLIPSSVLNLSSTTFPGPLFSDPGSPTVGLVRPGAAAQTKTKKARVIKYLEDRAEELSQGLGYMLSGSEDQGRTESKVVLFKILKILVENDGKLSGTPAVDGAVRAALVPQTSLDSNEASGFTSIADLQGADSAYMGLSGASSTNETPISITTLRPSALDKIEGFLLRGERRQAYHFALDQKLWAHAMIIASGIDKDAWQEVVNEFLKTELPSQAASTPSSPTKGAVAGREGLRVVYSLLSGQGAKSVHQLVPKTSLSNPAAALLAPMTVAATPMTPNFSVPMPAANIPAESLSKWAEIVAMMLSGSVGSETSATLTALGDQLAGNGWTEAAHVCYLLSPQTSTVAGPQHPSARIVLLGARNPHLFSNFMSDPDPIILSEIHEFALSLAPVPKGQEVFGGLPHLQGYRFIRAVCLAELGDVPIANRYCEAITASMNRPSPYYTSVLLERLKGLSDRIVGVNHSDKGGSWMGGKLTKPSLDGFGGWLEGRFAKLVTGDMESPTTAEHQREKTEDSGFVGPFSHYSTISSTTTSTSPSPQNSVVNLNAYAPPPRTGSALSTNSLASNGPTERAASAMDHSRPRLPPPVTRVASANASTSTFAQAQARSFGQAISSNSNDLLTPRPSLDSTEEDEGQEVTWWGSNNVATPTAASFVQLSGSALTPVSDGFVSLMDNHDYSVGPTSHSKSNSQVNSTEEEEDDDLGFGNSKPKPKAEGDDAGKPKDKEPPKAVPVRPDIKPGGAAAPASGSWLSRLWKRDSTGPVKASLGEESSFYYDANLKKWVNKKSGSEEAAKPATPPPPPSRAQTASPGGARPPSTGPPSAGIRPPSAGPPPPRASSAMDNAPRPPMRVRSNLVPSDEGGPGSAPSTPTGSRLAPPAPPPGRPRSQASKRNVRSRYVDVLQQEGAS